MSVRGWLVVSVLLVAFVAGCQSTAKGGEGKPAGAAGAPAGGEGTSASVGEGPAVVYGARIPPDPLTLGQREEILKVAKEHCPKGRSIWLLCVHSNREYDGKLSHWTSVYYSPDKQTPRLRRGSYIGTGAVIPPIGGWDPRFGERYFTFEQRPVRSRYCQVSPPAEPFIEELGTPQGLLLPFPAPKGFTGDEIVEIVDFVYSLKGNATRTYAYSESRVEGNASEDGSTPRESITYRIRGTTFDPGDPIAWIGKEGKAVTIGIGSCQGILSAFYTVLRCVKTVGGYKLIDSYNVIS